MSILYSEIRDRSWDFLRKNEFRLMWHMRRADCGLGRAVMLASGVGVEDGKAGSNLLEYRSHVKRTFCDGIDLLTHLSSLGLGGGGKDYAKEGVKGSLEAVADGGEKFLEKGVEGGGSDVLVWGGWRCMCVCLLGGGGLVKFSWVVLGGVVVRGGGRCGRRVDWEGRLRVELGGHLWLSRGSDGGEVVKGQFPWVGCGERGRDELGWGGVVVASWVPGTLSLAGVVAVSVAGGTVGF